MSVAVAYASSAGSAVTGGTLNVSPAKPAGTAAGDLLLAFAWASQAATWSAPGFTNAADNASTGGSAVLWRIADGSEGSTFTFTRGSVTTGQAGVVVVRITGHHPTAPLDQISFGTGGASTTIALAGQTPTGAGNLLVQMVTKTATTGAVNWTPPGTVTERADTAAAGNGNVYAIGDETVGAGATGTRTWTASGTSVALRGAMISVKPAAAGTSTGSAIGSWSAAGTAAGVTVKTGTAAGEHNWTGFATSGDGPSDSVAFAQFRAALANRDAGRVNIGLFGASVCEGYPAPIDLWVETQLARKIRAKYPTTGIATDGGYGYIGIPTAGLQNTATTPVGYSLGTFNESLGWGGHHRVWVATTLQTTPGLSLTLADAASSVVIETIGGATGHAVGGRYRVNGGTWVTFNTLAPSAQTILVTVPGPLSAGDVIEIAHNSTGTGNVVVSGFRVYKGDETKGIQVHNHGHYGYRIQDWNLARAAADPGWLSTMADYDLIIFSDWGGNDGAGPGDLSAAQFHTDFDELITWMRTSGYTGDILIASLYNIEAARTFVDPWSEYVDAMRLIALEQQVAFLQLDQYMPPTPNAIYAPDNVHGNVDGSAYDLMSDLFLSRIVPQEGSATGSWTAAGSSSGGRTYTGAASGSWSVAGSGSGSTGHTGGASGSWSAAGAATGKATHRGASAGAWTTGGDATGSAGRRGAATSAWFVAGSASGASARAGSTSGGWEATGTAGGFSGGAGFAAGTWTAEGAAAGIRQSKGAGVGAYSFTADTTGTTFRTGSASDGWAATGTAAGKQHPNGDAAGGWTTSATAHGGTTGGGSATGSWTATGAATGQHQAVGAGVGTLVVTGTADGAASRTGSAADLWSITGTATGHSNAPQTGDVTITSITETARPITITAVTRRVDIDNTTRTVTIKEHP